jgi:hypothetical protein
MPDKDMNSDDGQARCGARIRSFISHCILPDKDLKSGDGHA